MRKRKLLETLLYTFVAIKCSWEAPADDPDRKGFKIKIGTASGSYTQSFDVPSTDARTTTVNVDRKAGEKMYATVVAYSPFGDESTPAPEATFGGVPKGPFSFGVTLVPPLSSVQK